jgi:hypothetical protein
VDVLGEVECVPGVAEVDGDGDGDGLLAIPRLSRRHRPTAAFRGI